MPTVAVTGSFDDLRSRDVRFLEEAARLGSVYVSVWADPMVQAVTGKPPKFPLAERLYFLESIRFVANVQPADGVDPDKLPWRKGMPDFWAMPEAAASEKRREYCRQNGVSCQAIADSQLHGFPESSDEVDANPGRKKVLVTGCYDWLHTGHVRFFEEVSEYGDPYVVLGHDANVALLKGAGHPQFPQDERRYMVGAIRFVKRALIATGHGWLDAEPEIKRLRPDVYAVNEDGDRPEKKEYCQKNGIEYLVLRRLPKAGLPRRQSTELRGF